MRRRRLVILAKAPALGRVKRRLAAAIGAGAALGFYRRTLGAVLLRLGRDRRWQTVLAVTPDRAARRSRLWPVRLEARAQGPGDLGQRMGRVFRQLPPGPVVIVGADIPELAAEHIARAFGALGAADAVFGPAPDGGYWLVGLRRGPSLPGLFANVRWSSAEALDDTLANLRGRRVRLIDTLADVDDGAALARWRAARWTAS
ncbi:MAG: TIGR04282 family arsenosugar biosynthesis glycosyltransferase [Pseudomonadota bacterium]